MNVLITGADGQLGAEIKKVLNDNRSALGDIAVGLRGANLCCADLPEWDITDIDQTKRLVAECSPDIVINCAAYTNVDGCEEHKDEAFKVNALGARNLAVSVRECGAKLVHLSTDYVFFGNGDKPYSEWDICAPQSVYGHTKHMGEQYVREFLARYFIVRTSWLYGYVGCNFVKTILKNGRERGKLTVVDDQRGNPTNAADLAHHILKIAVTEEYGIYHCTGNGECSWYEFADEIIRLAGISCDVSPCTSDQYPTLAKRPAYSALDNRMLRCTVGDEMRDWNDALADYMTHYDHESGDIML